MHNSYLKKIFNTNYVHAMHRIDYVKLDMLSYGGDPAYKMLHKCIDVFKDPYRTIKAGDLPFICKFYSFEFETTRAHHFYCLFNFSRKTGIKTYKVYDVHIHQDSVYHL